MNKIYRIIWNSTLGQWIVTSELSRGKTKSTVNSTRAQSMAAPILIGRKSLLRTLVSSLIMGSSVVGATDITIDPTFTTGEYNNKSGSISVSGGTVNLSGTTAFSGSTPVSKTMYNLITGYNAGYATGPIDPSEIFTLSYGAQNTSVVVPDPVTGGGSTVNIYNNANIAEVIGSSLSFYVYKPTAAGAGPFIDAEIAKVTNGGTLNVNIGGTIGDSSVKNTTYVKVTDGTANWNSTNTASFATVTSDLKYGDLDPVVQSISTKNYAGTFTITTSDGPQTQTVNNLADYQAYNSWLAAQLQAGKLGSGTSAQINYNAAIGAAVTTTVIDYTLIKDPLSIPADDPMYAPNGTQVVMQADGANAVATISQTGALTAASGTAVLLATNGGTVINNGTLTTHSSNVRGGLVANTGGHAINHSVRNIGQVSGLRAEGGYDMVDGAGSTYVNTGTVNVAGWNYATTYGTNFVGLYVRNGGAAVNNGTYNVGNVTALSASTSYGALLDQGASSFVNESDGVMYLGRDRSTDTTSDPIERGGADVAQANGGYLIRVTAPGSTVENKGSLIIGDKVQNGYGIYVSTTSPVNVVNSGTITVNGHYSATPAVNYGIFSTSIQPGTIVNNAGTINLQGINNIGIMASLGGKASSSGVINVAGGADPTTGLRNYGLWSRSSGSKITLTGAVNLAGDGAIGVHARESGSIAIDGAGEVKFVSGTDQIGFFVYGPSASLTNTGSGIMDVSTERSTLFRMEDGADFTGGAGASSVLTASGKDSTAVMVTGRTGADVSAFNSGGMTLNLSGENAAGVLVEGGAQGKIASNANINLTGVGSVAGIADGQKHDLSGNNVGSPIAGTLDNSSLNAGAAGFGTGTLLVAGANLNSSLNNVTGYIARNGATLSNSGNITFNGKNTTGILVQDGSVGGNTGSITLNDGGVGLVASSSNLATTINNTGNLTLRGGTNANRTKGIQASGSAVTVNMTGGGIDMQGQGAVGVEALAGGEVILSGTSLPQFAAEATGVTDQIAFRILGNGSSILTNLQAGTVLDASGNKSTLFRIEDGATQSGVLQMKTSGKDSNGIWATGEGTTVVASSGSDFQILGAGAKGVYITGAAKGILKAGTSVSLVGDGAVVGVVDGNEYDLAGNILATDTGSTLTNESNIISTLNNAIGFITQNQGLLVNQGNIDFTQGTGNTGVKVINGQFDNVSNDIKVNGTAIYVAGAGSVVNSTGGNIVATNGEAAIKLGQDASLDLVGSGLGVIEGQGTAHGVLLDTGAKGLVIAGAKINVNAAGATGNGVENKAEIAGLQLTGTSEINVANGKGIRTAATLAQTNSGTINVNGSGTGLAFETATGGVVANTSVLDMSDSKNLVINLNGTGGTGILVNTADDAIVKTGASVNVNQTDGGSALIVNNSAKQVIQSGNLVSSSTTDAVVQAENAKSFTNSGKIIANSATAEAMSFNGSVNTILLNDIGAEIQGVVAMNGGNNQVTNKGLITGTLTAADGDNALLFDNDSTLTGRATLGQGNNQVTLNGTAHTDEVIAGSGINTFTIKGSGAAYDLLDGGAGTQDSLVFDAANHTITQSAKLQNFENVKLKNNSLVTVNDMLVLTDGGIGAGTVDIESGSEMAIRPALAGDFAFDPLLSGKGLLSVELDADTSAFDFTTNAGNQFAGTARLGLSKFDLSALNTASLTAATLQTDSGNITTVGAGEQNIGGLTISGGKLIFGSVMPGDVESDNSIVTSAAGTLDIRGSGTVQVTMPTQVINDVPAIDSRKSLFEQDDQTTLVKLVTAKGNVLGNGSAITLEDENGNEISNAQTFDINQNGTVVAEGSYDYKLMNGDGNTVDGLYIGYGLTQIDLLGTATDALILTPNTGASGKAADLSAKVTGIGDLAVEAGTQTVSLSNQLNDYSGDTTVRNGTLVMANDNVLGHTADLTVNNGATFKTTDGVGSYSQTVGALNTVAGASVVLAEGSTLTISDTQRAAGVTDGGTIANGTLTGAGELNIAASELVVNGANAGYTGDVTLSSASLVALDGAQGLGTQGTISFATAGDHLDINIGPLSGYSSNLSKSLAGEGSVSVQNVTDLTLSGDNSGFSGLFRVETDAALRASAQKHLGRSAIENEGVTYLTANSQWELNNSITGSGALVKQGADRLVINSDLAYTGETTVEKGTLIIGDALGSTGSLSGSSQVDVMTNSVLSGLGDITGTVNNQGTIASLNALTGYESLAAGNQNMGSLTNSGTLQLAGSQTGNTLTVNGNYIGGGTLVINTVLGDDNSATDKLIVTGDTSGSTGVVVNNVSGAGAQTVNGIEVVKVGGASNGNFTLNNRAVAGAYEYFLNKGGVATPNDGGWYLRSQLPDPVDPVTPVNPVNPVDPVNPTPANIIRPEAGSYMANMAAASKMFNLRLEDREGRAENSSMWLRQQGSRTTFHDTTGQSRTATNTYVVQGGGEVWDSHFNDSDRLGVGLMAAYGNASSETGSNRSGYNSKGTVDGYSTGVYATWYQDAKTLNGAYVDSWVQYSWLNGEVKGDQLSNESYNIDGLSASVEAGYRMPVYQGENGSVFITPQAQVTWNGIKADDHHEINGTRVTSSGDNNVQTRLGVKVSRDGVSDNDIGKDKLFTVYAEANWLNNSQQAGAVLDGVEVKQSGSRNLAEFKLGTEGQVNKNLNLWTNVAQQMGDDGYADTALTVGFKYKF